MTTYNNNTDAARAEDELRAAKDLCLIEKDGVWYDATEETYYVFEDGIMTEAAQCGTCGQITTDWETADDEYQEIVCKACREAKAAAI